MQANERPAFDLWLQRTLAENYRPVLKEPLPDEMLRLLAGAAPER